MSHLHKIVDTDLHFIIDPITRTIENQGDKRYLTQYDHESERFTFGVPRFIEGHDMTLCDRIEIHFTNITKKKDAQNDGMYVVDRDDKEFTDDFFKFSWKVRRESTQLVGILKFSITFLCGNEFSEIIYEWSTTEYKSIQILPKLDHSEEIVAKYPDLFVMLKREIYDEGMVIEDIQQTTTSEESGGINSFTVTLLDGSTRVFNVKNGVDGLPGVYVGSGEPPEDCDIQIDPDGEADEYITKKEFEELLKELPSDISKDYYDLENHPFERISSIGTVNGTGTTMTVDLSTLALEEKNFVRYYVNDNNYNIVRFVYNDKSCMITNSTIITIKMLVSGSDRRFVIYLHDQVISFDMIDGDTIFTKEMFIGRDEVLPKNNVNEYTPTKDYHPSTKKYVDDAVKDIKDSMNESADIPEEVLTYTEQSLTEEQQMQVRKNLGLYSYSDEVVLEHVIDTNDEYKIAERLIHNTLENGAEYYCIFAGYYFKCDSATVYQNGPGSFVTEAIFTPLNYALPSSAKIIYDGRIWSFDTGGQSLDISGLQTIKVYTKNVDVIPENFIPESIARKEELDQLSGQKIDHPSTGQVGQILEIETVDENGKPKTYKAVDKPQGGGEVSDEQISSAVNEYLTENPVESDKIATATSWNHDALDIANDWRVRNSVLLSTSGKLAHNACACYCGSAVANVWAEDTSGGNSDNWQSANVHSKLRFTYDKFGTLWKISKSSAFVNGTTYDLFPVGTEVVSVGGATYTIVSDSDNMLAYIDNTLHIFTMAKGSDNKCHFVHTSGTVSRSGDTVTWTPSNVFTEISLVVDGTSGAYDFTRINSTWTNPQINTHPYEKNGTTYFALSINGKGIAIMSFDNATPTSWNYLSFIEKTDINLEVSLMGIGWISNQTPTWILAYRTKNGYVRLLGLNKNYEVMQDFIYPSCNTRPRVFGCQKSNTKVFFICGGADRTTASLYLFDFALTPTLAHPSKIWSSDSLITDYVDGFITAGNGNTALYLIGTNNRATAKNGVSANFFHWDSALYTTEANNMMNAVMGSAVTVDENPTKGSSNPVSSGGVYNALQTSGGGSATWITLGEVTTTEETTEVELVFDSRKINRLMVIADLKSTSTNTENKRLCMNIGGKNMRVLADGSVGTTENQLGRVTMELTPVGTFSQGSHSKFLSSGAGVTTLAEIWQSNLKSTDNISSIKFTAGTHNTHSGGTFGVGTKFIVMVQ